MNSLGLLQLQQGLFGKLSADGVLMGMVHAIYDQVPERAQFPYAVIGDGVYEPLVTDAMCGAQCRIRIRIYSQKPGRKEVLRIMDRIYGMLHHGTISLVESSVADLRVARAQTQLLGDQRTIEGELNIACLIAEGV